METKLSPSMIANLKTKAVIHKEEAQKALENYQERRLGVIMKQMQEDEEVLKMEGVKFFQNIKEQFGVKNCCNQTYSNTKKICSNCKQPLKTVNELKIVEKTKEMEMINNLKVKGKSNVTIEIITLKNCKMQNSVKKKESTKSP